jgi:hypothetical protein
VEGSADFGNLYLSVTSRDKVYSIINFILMRIFISEAELSELTNKTEHLSR